MSDKEPFFGIDETHPRLAGLKATPETIEEALRRAAERVLESKSYPGPPMVVSPHTFKSWQERGLIVESPPGSGNWWLT